MTEQFVDTAHGRVGFASSARSGPDDPREFDLRTRLRNQLAGAVGPSRRDTAIHAPF